MGLENPVHLLFLGAVALLVLGPKRLPDLAKALGNGIREFRESISDGEDGEQAPVSPNGAPPPAATAAAAAPPPSDAPPPSADAPGPAAPDAPPPADGATAPEEPQG
jgi:sec-independent protein translocase protein TatA